ncbi:hypothetical protein GCM10007933_26490 [Zoogloea oryzae]|uniref:Uncharacterized protein n=1 Tax=Zoogloea oryzae TaxID=310767 RepID=A0ABQ6FE40_9RHOO|nr:hypothetical protein GCM10007933_26490 [Zoogloea oryzae]
MPGLRAGLGAGQGHAEHQQLAECEPEPPGEQWVLVAHVGPQGQHGYDGGKLDAQMEQRETLSMGGGCACAGSWAAWRFLAEKGKRAKFHAAGVGTRLWVGQMLQDVGQNWRRRKRSASAIIKGPRVW